MGGKDFIDREAIGTIWQAAKPALHMPSGPASFEISIMEKHGIRLPQTRGFERAYSDRMSAVVSS